MAARPTLLRAPVELQGSLARGVGGARLGRAERRTGNAITSGARSAEASTSSTYRGWMTISSCLRSARRDQTCSSASTSESWSLP